MPQPLSYHLFADCRTFFGVVNFFNVVSNVPFLIGGVLGPAAHLERAAGFHRSAGTAAVPGVLSGRAAHLFRLGLLPRGAPDNARLVWDRLPMTLGFAGLVAATVAERVDLKLGLRSLWPLLLLGVFTVIYWYGTERRGRRQRHSVRHLPGLDVS